MNRAAIVVVGGAGQRLGGVAKPWLRVGGVPIIDHILDAVLPHVQQCILVGQQPTTWAHSEVTWTQEEPAGSGPAAAIRAGLAVLNPDVSEVLLLAGDAPFIAEPLAMLLDAEFTEDGIALEVDGRVQYLCARILRAGLEAASVKPSMSMRGIFEGLRIRTIPASLQDADTWEDVAQLRQGIGMNDWLTAVAAKLGIDPTMDADALLDLTRDVAHNTDRKNAPLTTYLLGYAAASQQLSAAQIAELTAELSAMAKAQQ